MTTTEIEKRLTALEAEVADLKASKKPQNPWWDKIAGVFADNPRFEKAMRNTRQSKKSHRPKSRRAAIQSKRKAAK